MEPEVRRSEDGRRRCAWAGAPDYVAYHDREWGFPPADDAALFEALALESFQAGLSFLTILRKRDGFRRAFRGFDPAAVARLNRRSVERLLRDPGIVRHRGKIEATLRNARGVCDLQDEFGSLAAYVWRFAPPARRPPTRASTTPESDALSRDLRRRGFGFVGSTTVYAFMQAAGLVNDHARGCTARPLAREAQTRLRRRL